MYPVNNQLYISPEFHLQPAFNFSLMSVVNLIYKDIKKEKGLFKEKKAQRSTVKEVKSCPKKYNKV